MDNNQTRVGISRSSAAELPLESFYKWERERGNRLFLTQPFGRGHIRTWTWAQAGAEARRIAAYLQRKWPAGTRIGILSRNCAWWILGDLAMWMAGHVSVPVYPSLKASSVRQILEHSGCKACFLGLTDEGAGEGIPEDAECIRFPSVPTGAGAAWDEIAAANAPLAGAPTRAGDDLATIIYTSGTTGAPKGVMHTFSGFSFASWTLAERFGLDSGYRFFSYLPLAHILERAGLEAPVLYLGAQVYFTEGLETFVSDLQRARPTIFLSVPRLLFKLQEGVFAKIEKERLEKLLRIPIVRSVIGRRILGKMGLASVSHAACGGAALPPEMLAWYRRLGLDLAEGYGTTETMITHVPIPGTVMPGYVGQAVSGVETKIGPGGEVLIKSPMNMRGYYNDPAATREAVTDDGFYRTGDIGEIEPGGQLRIVGRIKEQFKTSKGKYISPAPIESKLLAHPAIESCCLMGAGSPNPFAVVVLADNARARCTAADGRAALEDSLEKLVKDVNSGLDHHERLAFLVVADGPWSVANGLLTPTMKLKRGALEAMYRTAVDEWTRQGRTILWESAPNKATGTAAQGAA